MLKRHYPGFDKMLESIPDHRQRSTYQVAEIVMAGLSMFIFKRKSRNHWDNSVLGHFETNYVTMFGMRLPLMETVDEFLRQLSTETLEDLKRILIQKLLERKVLDKWKYNGRYLLSIDGTGLLSYDYEPFEGCPYKVSKKGKVSWQVYVLEAKIICGNGFNLSIGSEWLKNSEDLTDKQDCEQKAFVRLAKKIKTKYPRLPVLITADGLYPNKTNMDICAQNNWDYIFVLQNGSLKTVWEEIHLLYPLEKHSNLQEGVIRKDKKGWLNKRSMFINDIQYKGHILNWIEYQEYYPDSPPHKYFAHITNMDVDKRNAWDVSEHGRLRWVIENQGFNTQKNGGYALQHKYSRKHLWAMKNYYELLQIAHMINQLAEKLIKVKQAIERTGTTLMSIVEDMAATMKKQIIEPYEITLLLSQNKQMRY